MKKLLDDAVAMGYIVALEREMRLRGILVTYCECCSLTVSAYQANIIKDRDTDQLRIFCQGCAEGR